MSLSGEAGEKAKSDIEHYLTCRVTCPHVDVRRMLESVFKDADYICYRHKGTKTHKEHVHVLVPDVSLQKKLKDRLRLAGYKGNETYSIKGMHNGLYAGIQYCSKEGGVPLFNGDFEDVIREAPKWVDKRMDSYLQFDAKPRTERNWELSYSNLVPQAVSYARQCGLTELSLTDVVKEMIRKTKWKPTKSMLGANCGGIPQFLRDDFEFRLGRKSDYDWSWMEPRGFFNG